MATAGSSPRLGVAYSTTLLAGFVTGLHRDLAAVQAALDLPWTPALPKDRSTASR